MPVTHSWEVLERPNGTASGHCSCGWSMEGSIHDVNWAANNHGN